MDISSVISTMVSSESLKNIGKASNTDASTVKKVLGSALPSLISGAKAQSSDASTGFAEALLSHSKDDTSDLSSFLGKVDLKDGSKIIGHLLGSNSSSEISSIARSAGTTKKDTSNVLSAAAPLLMSLLGKEASSGSSDNSSSGIGSVASLLLKNADVGSLLTGLLTDNNGSSEKPKPASSGKKKEESSSGLFGLLGKLFK